MNPSTPTSAAMKAAGKVTESVGFDAAHGFTNPTSPRYDEAADKASWACIVDFLQRHFGEPGNPDSSPG